MVAPLFLALVLMELPGQVDRGYDPLKGGGKEPRQLDLLVEDKARDRKVPLWVYVPETPGACPVVLFSHGLGGSRKNGQYLGKSWGSRGLCGVFLQHPGSDESVWREAPLGQRMSDLKKAANLPNFQARVQDVSVTLDQLEKWNGTQGHPLHGKLNLKKVGMSGHSFGAVTSQAVSGQTFPLGRDLREPRITAALLLSPSTPKTGDPARAFGKVSIPWMLMTGTLDGSPIGDQTPESRRKVYPALPPGNKFGLVLDGAEHSAFSDRVLPGENGPRNPNHHRVIVALSNAFWDAYLLDKKPAQEWLQGEMPGKLMEKKDVWQRK